ncbi:hypothetical protein DD606_23800, partial [Enterobacter cloacae complex sp. GF14B]
MAGSQDTALYNIKKLDGTNFPLWKKQIWHVLVQKKQIKPIKLKGIKPEDMDEDEWSEMDELALSTIMLTLAESVYFNVADEMSAYQAWLKLSDLYEKQSAASQVYWLKKLVDLKMKEGTPMSNHLNEFNTIYSQLSAQGVKFDEPVRAMFLLITLPESWDTFRTALSNSAPQDGLNIAGVEGSLLTEETNRKTMDKGKGTALVVRGRTKEKYKGGKRNQSRSTSRSAKGKSDIECYHCGKKGHMKRDCREWKAEKGKEKAEDHGEKNKSSVKIQEINVTNTVAEDDSLVSGDIYFLKNTMDSALLTASDGNALSDWIIDSGASLHVSPNKEWFTSYVTTKDHVRLGNGQTCEILGVGDVQLKFQNGSSFTLKNVRHVPAITKSLISTGLLDDAGYVTTFGQNMWKISKGSMTVAHGVKSGGLYMIYVSNVSKNVINVTEQPNVSLWHSRLGHMSKKGMEILSRSGYLPGFSFNDFEFCEHCLYGKQTQQPHKHRSSRRDTQLALVHSDLCGPMPNLSLGGASYFMTFIDDYSRKVWVYFLKHKDEAFSVFKTFVTLVENQSGKKLKCLRTDNGGEYVSKAFQDFCESKGIKRELTAPYNPPQNGVAERMNRTIQEKVRSMLSNAQLPNGFWAEAVSTAVHLVNRSPSKVLQKDSVPEMVWSGKMPSYKHLRVFGCEAYTHVPKEFRNKLEPKSRKCIFLGYGNSGEMGYRLWDPESRKVVRSNDVHFNESKYHSKPERVEEIRRVVFQEDGPARARQNVRAQEEQGQDRVEPQVVAEPEPPIVRRSGRVTRPPDRFVPSMNYVMLTDCNEPSCYKEAVQMKDSGNWQLAMQSEMTALHKNKTWKLVKLPQGKKALPCKWVYRYKITAHDSQPKYKARLVAKG